MQTEGYDHLITLYRVKRLSSPLFQIQYLAGFHNTRICLGHVILHSAKSSAYSVVLCVIIAAAAQSCPARRSTQDEHAFV